MNLIQIQMAIQKDTCSGAAAEGALVGKEVGMPVAAVERYLFAQAEADGLTTQVVSLVIMENMPLSPALAQLTAVLMA